MIYVWRKKTGCSYLIGFSAFLIPSILTPTAQNVANLEADMRLLAEKLVADGAAEDVVRLEIEKLVRAYDPCLSCSVH